MAFGTEALYKRRMEAMCWHGIGYPPATLIVQSKRRDSRLPDFINLTRYLRTTGSTSASTTEDESSEGPQWLATFMKDSAGFFCA